MNQLQTLMEIRPNRKLHIMHWQNPSEKTIFFLHGLGGRAEQFQAQIDFFKKDYNIIAADMLGHGQSQKPKKNAAQIYSFNELYQDIQIIFDRYRSEENFVIGHSYGGGLAAYLAYNNLDKIKKLILLTPTALQPNTTIPKIYNLPVFILELLRPLLTQTFVKLAFDPNTDPKLIEHEIKISKQNPMYVIKSIILGMQKIPYVEVNKISLPALVILGEHDRLIPMQQRRAPYQPLPNVKFKEIKNAAHLVMLEQPAEVNLLIENFLK